MDDLLTHESGAEVFELHLREPDDQLAEVLAAAPDVAEVQPIDNERPGYTLTLTPEAEGPNGALRAALDHGAHIVDFKRVTRHLNDAFMDLTEAGVRS